jgi:hypothetical protein
VIAGAGRRHYMIMNALRVASLAASAMAALSAFASPSRAEAGTGLVYRRADECPAENEFVAAVDARGGRFDRARPDGTARAFEISISKSESGFRGSLQVRGSEGPSVAREVHAQTCAEVVDGLAVVTAIALRDDSPPPSRPAEVEPPPDDHRLRAVNIRGVDSVRVKAGTLAIDRAMTYSFSAGLAAGIIPSLVLPRYDLSISRANFITPPDGDHYVVGSIVRVRLSALGDGTYRSGDYSTSVLGFSFGMDLCHSPLYDTRAAVVLLCLEYAGGVMQLDTRNGAGTVTQTKVVGLGTVGVSAELQYNLGAYFHLGLRVGGDVSVSNLTAERPDGSRLFHSQPFSGYALVGVGFHF